MVTIFSIISIVVFYRYLFISTFQPIIAATMGISVKAIHYFLMLLLSFAIVASLRTVGIILVVAMLVTPSATALLLSNKLKNVIIISGIIGFLSAASGLVLAIIFDTTPGPAMCVVVTILYFSAVFFSPKNGLVPKKIRKIKLKAQIEKEDILKYLSKNKAMNKGQFGEIGTRLGITLSRLNQHVSKLVSAGNVTKTKNEYKLTSQGNQIALDLVRAHRLWETFLVSKVGLKDDEIHEDAEKYEHLLDKEILDQLDAKLGYPNFDPHGSPIPSKSPRVDQPLINQPLNSQSKISENQLNDHVESVLWELGLPANSYVQLQEINKEEVIIKHDEKLIKIPNDIAKEINIES